MPSTPHSARTHKSRRSSTPVPERESGLSVSSSHSVTAGMPAVHAAQRQNSQVEVRQHARRGERVGLECVAQRDGRQPSTPRSARTRKTGRGSTPVAEREWGLSVSSSRSDGRHVVHAAQKVKPQVEARQHALRLERVGFERCHGIRAQRERGGNLRLREARALLGQSAVMFGRTEHVLGENAAVVVSGTKHSLGERAVTIFGSTEHALCEIAIVLFGGSEHALGERAVVIFGSTDCALSKSAVIISGRTEHELSETALVIPDSGNTRSLVR